jgi:twitching motility protein PilT
MSTTETLSSADKFEAILGLFMDKTITETIVLPGNRLYSYQWGALVATPLEWSIEEDDILDMIREILAQKNTDEKTIADITHTWNERGHFNFSYVYQGIPVRVNWCRYQSKQSIQLRKLPQRVNTPEELGIPPQILEAVKSFGNGGLMVVSAPTGNGKSTTIASVVQEFARDNCINLITLEDPVEYLYDPESAACIRQRELLFDFDSFETGIEACMRQTPQIVIVQEMTTPEVTRQVIRLMKKGCLVITTLHTPDATSIFDSIISSYPEEEKKQIRNDLKDYFRCFVSQRLVPKRSGWIMALFEVLLPGNEVNGIIAEGNFNGLQAMLEREGNISFVRSFLDAVISGAIDLETARANCPQTRIKSLLTDLGEE